MAFVMSEDARSPAPAPPATSEEERAKAIALLEAAHQFPVRYELSVITVTTPEIAEAIRAAIAEIVDEELTDADHEMIPSRGGKYTSHRLRVPCAAPEHVLAVYARLRILDGVKTLI